MQRLGLFITGTDTNVGKTRVAATIARQLVREGVQVGVYKPAASGCVLENGRLISDDALELGRAAGVAGELEHVCPQRFAAPLAPHLAAHEEGREIDSRQLRTGVEYWQSRSDFVIVEGAGGLLSPLGEREYVADLAADFGWPLVVVAANRIGVVNQTLQTLVVARSFRGGIPVAAVVLNDTRPIQPQHDPSVLSNLRELERHCNVSLLVGLSHGAERFDRQVDWQSLATLGGNRYDAAR